MSASQYRHYLRTDAPESILQSLAHCEPNQTENDMQYASQYPHGGGKAKNVADDGINSNQHIWHNPPIPLLYEIALKSEKGSFLTSTGALATLSGSKTGRSPRDKRIVDEPSSSKDVWWGPVNFKLEEHSFMVNRERAIDFLNLHDQLYVIDAFAGWDPKYRVKVRIICTRAYHAIFMKNMLIRPTAEERANFGKPDFTIYNAGCFPSNRFIRGITSEASVALDFGRMEMVILGTQYAGEMKKGILTLMMHLGPKNNILTLHSSANEGPDGRSTVFFGLSGTGKTTLSADPKRLLIGDDEHVWTDEGIFNVEGGCYAKCINLKRESEPEIYDAIKFGAILENVVMNQARVVDYDDISITENTRCAYPLQHIPNAKIPAVTCHPTNVVLLTCDAFGVLPPVSRLTEAQVMYQFISGYTAKVAGTEEGVTEPTATFSACFGGPFLVWHPTHYARQLADKLKAHNANAWLLNTGWTGGKYGEGKRISLKYTRAMVDAINNGELAKIPTTPMPGFGFGVPESCPGCPSEILNPMNTWADKDAYVKMANKLAGMFVDNFKKYQEKADPELLKASPTQVS